MAARGEKCPDCGLKRGHKPGCVRANACPECGYTTGHDGHCPHAANTVQERVVALDEKRARKERTVVDGQSADVVFDGKTGGPLDGPQQQELITVSVEELLDTLATELAIRQRYANERDKWQKKVKAADENIDKVTKALADRGHLKESIMQRLDAVLPEARE